MTTCETRVKPFDVSIKNRMANMTSVDCATQLVDTNDKSNEGKE